MIKQFMARLMAVIFALGLIPALGGCNTMEGAGKDIEKGGTAIKNEAKEHKKY